MSVKVGKNIIEVLTTGMYTNPLFMYREYIQNSVDQIDQAVDAKILSSRMNGQINIQICNKTGSIEVFDNASGIKADKVWDILTAIADSTKNRLKNRGFRGIGRLGGLAYCEKLVFETSAQGESVKTRLCWDAASLRRILNDPSEKLDAHEVVQRVATLENEEHENDDHFFRVSLEGVTDEALLDIRRVREYVSQVAPVPFDNKFIFKTTLYDEFERRDVRIDEYCLFINSEQIYKLYCKNIYKLSANKTNKETVARVIDITFFEVKAKGEVLAVGWVGTTDCVQKIPPCNISRGLRIRKGNIQIGDADTFRKLFKDGDGRFHNYYVGELYVTSSLLVPNARRDYFDQNHALHDFENELRHFTKNDLSRLAHRYSEFNSAAKKIEKHNELVGQYDEKIRTKTFATKGEQKELEKKLEKSSLDAEKATKAIDKLKVKATENQKLGKIMNQKAEGIPSPVPVPNPPKKKKQQFVANNMTKLPRKEQKLVGEIFEIIRETVPPDTASEIIKRISQKFS